MLVFLGGSSMERTRHIEIGIWFQNSDGRTGIYVLNSTSLKSE